MFKVADQLPLNSWIWQMKRNVCVAVSKCSLLTVDFSRGQKSCVSFMEV